jgi:hypothetical protein
MNIQIYFRNIRIAHIGTAFTCGYRLCLLIKHFQYESTSCNVRLKQMKYLEHTLATYVYSHCNICNIQIKHLQHMPEVDETF